jgi:hypothetical protein
MSVIEVPATVKTCVSCAHHSGGYLATAFGPFCMHPKNGKVHPVSGMGFGSCERARDPGGPCGPDGSLWKRAGWLKRILRP